jgi:phosphoribosylglycinamide formyltransferase 1
MLSYFCRNYERLLYMIRIAIFASGNGTNAQRIIEYFREREEIITVSLILSNNAGAFVLERAKNMGMPAITFNRSQFYDSTRIIEILNDNEIEFIVLAGFLWLVPDSILNQYPGRIINIHPALLPMYGGKGMYGMKVHEAVIANHDKESGITVHLVNQHYDNGQILFQAKCSVEANDSATTLAEKIHALEYEYFPKVIESYILKGISSEE